MSKELDTSLDKLLKILIEKKRESYVKELEEAENEIQPVSER
jgi:hypothetical protein